MLINAWKRICPKAQDQVILAGRLGGCGWQGEGWKLCLWPGKLQAAAAATMREACPK